MPDKTNSLDFSNTEIAFSYKSDKELKELRWLFKVMNNKTMVSLGSLITPMALKLKLPLVKSAIKRTIFKQFVGGESLLDTQKKIDLLQQFNTSTILDFGAESKTSEEDLDHVMNENIRALEFAASNSYVPAAVTKLTGLASNDLLIKMQTGEELTSKEEADKKKLIERLDKICKRAYDLKVGIMIDAEESWLQITIDKLADEMMATYNQSQVIVYNTFQMYRHDKLDFLKASLEKAEANNYYLGAKLVRGAYMDKENNYAEEKGVPTLINSSKTATDNMYNDAISFCVNNFKTIGSVCASHNKESNLHQAALIDSNGIQKNHPHLNFCQLLGMSDNITFNLAKAGYNVAKYLPYGPLNEVIPYLIRRAKENTSVTGDMSRELSFIVSEIKRRKL